MKPGRNDPCPCASGRKFKQCCGAAPATAPSPSLSRWQIDSLVELINREQLAEAERGARALLAQHPESAILWKVLSVTLVRQGKDALAALHKAAALNPSDAEAQANLGTAFLALAQWAPALERLTRALTLRPDDLESLIDVARALQGLQRAREAISYYQRALQLEPGHVLAHRGLGDVFIELGRFDSAVASYSEALALRPDLAPLHLSLALALRQLGRAAAAESSCRSALQINPRSVEALTLLGELHSDRGRFADAQQHFRQALALDPQFPPAVAGLVAYRQVSGPDAAWLRDAQALLAKRMPAAHEIGLRYALGKYFDDVGDYAQAFGYFRSANELGKLQGARYDAADFTRRIDQIITRFDARFLRAMARPAVPCDLPVFVVGMPRSGTSLTEQILASHPAVFGAGEIMYWNQAYNALRREQSEGQREADLLSRLGRDYRTLLAGLSYGDAQRVIDKMPANFLYLGLIHAVFPGARIIHMQRHPLDTCLSNYFQHFSGMGRYANDLEDLAHYYGGYLRIMAHWRAHLPGTALLEVPYEALVADPEAWSRRMIEFIGLPWHPDCLDFHQTERAVITASNWQVRQKIHARSAGRWRNYAPFLAPLHAALGTAVARYPAYDPPTAQPIPGALELHNPASLT